jgi:hypothetical protein
MTNGSPASPEPPHPGDDQEEEPLSYGHGRMPLFMKIAWIAFLAFATWYVVQFLLTSVGKELGA